MPREREGADSEAPGHVGQMKGKGQGGVEAMQSQMVFIDVICWCCQSWKLSLIFLHSLDRLLPLPSAFS